LKDVHKPLIVQPHDFVVGSLGLNYPVSSSLSLLVGKNLEQLLLSGFLIYANSRHFNLYNYL